jgi:hypothetical protein
MAQNDQIDYISLENLVFDPRNSRLPPEVDSGNEEKIIEYMLRDASLLELMKSIGENDYSRSEPLLVVPSKGEKFVVVEGNRRLAALKILSHPHLATVRQKSVEEIISAKKYSPVSIPCITHKKRDDILDYLGYRHITGVKSWGALEKARYVEQLFQKHKSDDRSTDVNFKILARIIGSRADHVGRLLSSLRLYDFANDKAYFDIEIKPKEIDFSILYTAIGYGNIHTFVGLESSRDIDESHVNTENFEFIFRRLYDPRQKISESSELAELNEVVGNLTALEMYKKGLPLSEAVYYTDAPIVTFKTFLGYAKKSLSNARNCLDRLTDLDDETDNLITQVRELEKIARSIRRTLEEDEE